MNKSHLGNEADYTTLLAKSFALTKRAGLDWFILALVGMIGLAYIWPEPGVQEGTFSLSDIASFGVSLIFLFYGLKLNPEKLKAGLKNWRLHVVIQATTFILFPLMILAFRSFFKSEEGEMLWLGIFFLAALPSTVSSSVVMVSIAGGNLPAAIFNASISSLGGIFITPLWMGMVIQAAEGSMDQGSVMGKLMIQVLLPVTLGILLHGKYGAFALKHSAKLRVFDQITILLIVYTSFCESFAEKMFEGYRTTDLLLMAAGMLGLFLLIFMFTKGISRLLHFNREDRITVIFCGSKKSLVHGTVMAKVLFAGSSMMGIILLPIMVYHALQLMAASVVAQSMAQSGKKEMSEI